jgi:hypothetical protein
MISIRVSIVGWVDDCQPGIVKCALQDAYGQTWEFIEKLPIVAAAELDKTSTYPQPAEIACEVIRDWENDKGQELVTIDTDNPWGVESTQGTTRFDVFKHQLIAYP